MNNKNSQNNEIANITQKSEQRNLSFSKLLEVQLPFGPCCGLSCCPWCGPWCGPWSGPCCGCGSLTWVSRGTAPAGGSSLPAASQRNSAKYWWKWLLLQECTLGYSDFHNLMGFTSKKIPNNTVCLKMFVKKVFQLVKPFLANLHYPSCWAMNSSIVNS